MSNAHASSHGHDHEHHGRSHGSLKSYVIGFVLCLVLTALSFGAVMSGYVPHGLILTALVVFGVAQLLVQLIFFLHMGTSPDQRDNTSIFIFTALIITIVVAGSLWVMHNANVNMMPAQMSDDAAMSHD